MRLQKRKMEKVVIGMSGGVDSSVAAYLLQKQGYEVIGVTMQTIAPDMQEEGCSTALAVEDAKKVADHLGIAHHVIHFEKEFKENVMDYFVQEYLDGKTPNPCNACNRHVKWEALLKKANEFGANYIATGHYASIDRLDSGRYAICNSVTAAKDQTYALYNLTQEQLSHTLMPVGAYEKSEIRKMAEEIGIDVANKPDSQDICFIPDGDYAGFIASQGARLPGEGNFVTKDGKVLGKHKGFFHYTIGQRRGLGLAMGHHVFVTAIRPENNEVVIGESEDLFDDTALMKSVNYMAMEEPEVGQEIPVIAKIRYAHKGDEAVLSKNEDGTVVVKFEKPQRAITPGQALVCYQGEYVVCGGTIM